MSMPTSNHSAVPLFRRIIAALSVALLLLLSVSAVAPTLHDHLHGDGADHEATGAHLCAVVMFATGVALAAAIAFAVSETTERRETVARSRQLFFPAVRYLRPHPCGPPVC